MCDVSFVLPKLYVRNVLGISRNSNLGFQVFLVAADISTMAFGFHQRGGKGGGVISAPARVTAEFQFTRWYCPCRMLKMFYLGLPKRSAP
jgi:hypothetical protein